MNHLNLDPGIAGNAQRDFRQTCSRAWQQTP
jgi:hypothetical protein